MEKNKINYSLVDMEEYPRRQHYNHYMSVIPCTYSMTTKIDVTPIIRSTLKIYPSMIYAITKVVNSRPEFRLMLNNEGRLGVYDKMHPSYTIFHKAEETFSTMWTEYRDNLNEFMENYKSDMDKFGECLDFEAKKDTPANSFPVSMIPWESFDGFNLNLEKGYGYLSPIFTMGKFLVSDGKYLMPLAIQVHHAACDGYHVCKFLEELKRIIQNDFNPSKV